MNLEWQCLLTDRPAKFSVQKSFFWRLFEAGKFFHQTFHRPAILHSSQKSRAYSALENLFASHNDHQNQASLRLSHVSIQLSEEKTPTMTMYIIVLIRRIFIRPYAGGCSPWHSNANKNFTRARQIERRSFGHLWNSSWRLWGNIRLQILANIAKDLGLHDYG